MKVALIAGIVAAAVASGSAMATGSAPDTHGRPTPPAHHAAPPAHHAAAPAHRPARPSPGSSHPLSAAQIQAKIAAWSAAHPGWKNPAGMTHAELLQAAIDHPEVYGPNLNRSSRALRIIEQYGAWSTLPPDVRALERAQGIPIPENLPYVPASADVPAAALARIKAAWAAFGRR